MLVTDWLMDEMMQQQQQEGAKKRKSVKQPQALTIR
jgi:hypothetical protein